ncbi:hypothetical protein Acsp01_59050 [Actinoplanes sp. NBRC 101535]|nr:hypothetical protein Acsp01_59050 [Actinoplanes sp. NBRC 101535]
MRAAEVQQHAVVARDRDDVDPVDRRDAPPHRGHPTFAGRARSVPLSAVEPAPIGYRRIRRVRAVVRALLSTVGTSAFLTRAVRFLICVYAAECVSTNLTAPCR